MQFGKPSVYTQPSPTKSGADYFPFAISDFSFVIGGAFSWRIFALPMINEKCQIRNGKPRLFQRASDKLWRGFERHRNWAFRSS
jgi:hypothetical protein